MASRHQVFLALSLATAYGIATWVRRAETTAAASSPVSVFLRAFVATFVILHTAYGVWKTLLYPLCFSPLRHLPGPKDNTFFLGQFPRIYREPTGSPALDWINSIPNDGLIRYLGIFNEERLLVTKPRALAEVLVSKNYDFVKPSMVRYALSRFLGVGILLAEGDEHRFQRKSLAPAFAFRHVKDLYPVFWRKGRESVAAIRQQLAQPPVDGHIEVNGWASRTTLDIIGLAGMGCDFNAIRDPNNKLVATYRSVFAPSGMARMLGFLGLVFPRWLIMALPVRRNADMENASRFLRQTCSDLVREKKAKLLASKRAEADGSATLASSAGDVDILSVALESGGFSEESLADQLMTFLAAGHETTSAALTWAVYMLCLHPDIQERLRSEIRANLPPLGDDLGEGEEARDITSMDIDHLPYLNAFCSEVLRLYSPVPSTLRDTAVDTTIQGHFVPRGTRILLVPWAINKSQELWGADAQEFDPERWMREGRESGGASAAKASSAPSNYAFLTFLHGPRSCIGMGFARAEFACLVAAWAGRFHFQLHDMADADPLHLEITGQVSARPKRGMHVIATPVEGW